MLPHAAPKTGPSDSGGTAGGRMDVRTRNGAGVDLYHGDCLDVIPRLDAGSVDLTFLDPPFNQGKEYENHDDLMDEGEYWDMMHDVCRHIRGKTSAGGAIYFMHREKNLIHILNILDKTGWHFQNLIIWRKKTSAVPMSRRYGKNYQVIVFATKGKVPATFNKLRIDPALPETYKIGRKNGLYVTDVWDDIRELTSGYYAGDEPIRTGNNDRFHKQQTSLNILLRIILSSSRAGDTVLDPFAGTGTTPLVASQLYRRGMAIEKAARNIRCIRDRLQNMRDVDRVDRFYESYRYTDDLDNIWGRTHPKGQNGVK